MRSVGSHAPLAIVATSCAILALVGSCLGQPYRSGSEIFQDEVSLLSDRLPGNVKPINYNIQLDFVGAIANAAKQSEPLYYTGKVVIDVDFDQEARKRKSGVSKVANKLLACYGKPREKCPFERKNIVLHADKSVEITSVQVVAFLGKALATPLQIASTSRDTAKQLIVIGLKDELPEKATEGQIRLTFKAPIRRDEQHGVYLSTARRDNHVYHHIVAKFQPTFARLALPCFDEPGFKTTFNLDIEHDSSTEGHPIEAYANMEEYETNYPDDHIRRTFVTSPQMSIHMVAFIVGSFNTSPLTITTKNNVALRFLGAPDELYKGEFALEVAEKAIAWFEDFIGHKFPLEKLDIVAIAETDTDNTETWGLVFVRDNLAVIEHESLEGSKITTAVNVAHVVVHQWFANLITAKWWDDLWLTENVAAQMAFEFLTSNYPQFESEYLVRIGFLSGVLNSDGTGKMHSISPPEGQLSTSAQIYKIFDVLTFMKSGAVARMMQNLLGYELYRTTLRDLVNRYDYDNFDLAQYLEVVRSNVKSDEDFGKIKQMFESFSKLTSYPLVDVSLSHPDTKGAQTTPGLVVSLEPFYQRKKELNINWYTPMKALVSDGASKSELVPVVFDSTMRLPSWFDATQHFVKLQPNPDFSTYYRIRYSDELLHRLETPISHPQQQLISPMDRLHILDDANALVKSKLISNEIFSELVGWHANEDNFAMMVELAISAGTLAKLDLAQKGQQSPALQVFQRLFETKGFEVSGTETILEQRARSVVLKAMVAQGSEQVIKKALETFAQGNVALFLREPVYAAVVRAGTQEEVEQLLDQLTKKHAYEEKLRLVSALATSQNLEVLEKLRPILNEPFSFKPGALEQIVAANPKLAIEDGIVVIKSED